LDLIISLLYESRSLHNKTIVPKLFNLDEKIVKLGSNLTTLITKPFENVSLTIMHNRISEIDRNVKMTRDQIFAFINEWRNQIRNVIRESLNPNSLNVQTLLIITVIVIGIVITHYGGKKGEVEKRGSYIVVE
jgi:hypothetical protein